MKVYVCAPMSGVPQGNIPAIDAAATDLRKRGYKVVSPAELDSPKIRKAVLASNNGLVSATTWGECLARDIRLIADDGIDAIVVLPGWRNSRGARLETFVARLLGIPVLHYRTEDPLRKVATTSLDHAHTGGTS